MLQKVVSGGQTGVDRAALDIAMALGIPVGGWCPRGRRSEDGRISERYPLQETPGANYSIRTEWNVRDSDGTVLLTWGAISGGTRLTRDFAERYGRPHWSCDIRPARSVGQLLFEPELEDSSRTISGFCEWMREHQIEVLNIAGPRGSTAAELQPQAETFLRVLLEAGRGEFGDC